MCVCARCRGARACAIFAYLPTGFTRGLFFSLSFPSFLTHFPVFADRRPLDAFFFSSRPSVLLLFFFLLVVAARRSLTLFSPLSSLLTLLLPLHFLHRLLLLLYPFLSLPPRSPFAPLLTVTRSHMCTQRGTSTLYSHRLVISEFSFARSPLLLQRRLNQWGYTS